MTLVSETRDGVVLTLTLESAPAHPLSLGMIRDLHAALDRAAADRDARLVVIDGPGHIFCAGHDLKEIARHRADADDGEAYLTELFTACGDMMQALVAMPQATLARIEGIATAGGLQLVASCDLAIASPEATFALPGVRNGGFCTTPAVAVGRAVGRKALMDLALSGKPKSADWALRTGLISEVLPTAELDGWIADLAETLAASNPVAIAAGKRMTYAQLDMPLAQAYAEATQVMIGHFMDPERIARERARWASKA